MLKLDQARWLLREYLNDIVLPHLHNEALYLVGSGGVGGQFLPHDMWLNVNLGAASVPEREQLRAFVEVISQLSKSVDFQWRGLYHSFWKPVLLNFLGCPACSHSVGGNPDPTQYDNLKELTKSEGARFILDCSRVTHDGNQLKMLRDFIFMDPTRALGEDRGNLLSKLTGRDRPGRADGVSDGKVLRIELGVVLSYKRLAASSDFRALAKVLEEIAEHEQLKAIENYAVRYEITRLWIPSEKSFVPVEIDILTDMIASETCSIQHVHILNAQVMLTVDKRLQVFQQLLRTTVCSLDDSEPTLKSLHLQQVPLIHSPMASICSALRYLNSLKELELNWPAAIEDGAPANGNTKLMWAWIAFGIFHPDSEARLDRLNLSGLPLTYEDLTTFAATIWSPHPARYLWILEHGDLPQGAGLEEILLPTGQRVFVQLKDNTKMRVGPNARAKALESVTLELEEFEVAIDMTAWICVVVPGCGLGWVPISSVVLRREMLSKCPAPVDQDAFAAQLRSGNWPLAGANVKTFDRSSEGKADVLENIKILLRMIGRCLEGFNYPSHQVRISDTDLGEILDSCPTLTHLNLKGNSFASISPIVDRYRSRQCQISSLNIHTVEGQTQVLSQLLDLLESPFSKPLQCVAVNGMVETAECFRQLVSVLKTNKSVLVLFLYSANPEHRSMMVYIREFFQRTTGASKCPLRSKVALLSVIQWHSERSSRLLSGSSSLGKLDSSIASQIFAFAELQTPPTRMRARRKRIEAIAMAMPTMRSHAQAQWLLGQCLEVLDERHPSSWRLSFAEFGEHWARALPRKSWINAPLGEGKSEAQTAARAHTVRALVEVVAQLSHTPAFKWVDFYDTFWRHALLAKIRDHTDGSFGRKQSGTEYDCFEQLKKTSAPRFMLDFSDGDFLERELEILRDFFFATPAHVLGKSHHRVLSELKGDRILGACVNPPPRVEIGIYLAAPGITGVMLQKLHRLLKDVVNHGKTSEASVRFDVTTIWTPGCVFADAAKIEALTDIVAF